MASAVSNQKHNKKVILCGRTEGPVSFYLYHYSIITGKRDTKTIKI